MLSMQNVSFTYQNKVNKSFVHVLENISVQFEKGKIYSILGPSGSGKTTLLSLLGGLESPEKGLIILDGENIKDIGYVNLRKTYISFVFQNYFLFPYLSALDNVLLVMDDKRMPIENRRKKAEEILTEVGLQTDEIVRKIKFLSGGQQQRVAIARCLATGADYILADEPTGNLDSENARMIMDIFATLSQKQNKCIIIATHSEMVKKYSDISFKFRDKGLEIVEKA